VPRQRKPAPPDQQHKQKQHQLHTPQQSQLQQTSLQQQHAQQRQPSGSDWVMSGLSFAAGSERETAKAAAIAFMVSQLNMADAAQQVSIVRVSRLIPGLAVIRLADSDSERAMRSAKAKLPSSCQVSIYRSLPPEQRRAAAMLRQSQRQPQYITAEEAAAARSAANSAAAFARSRLAAAARSSGSSRTLSLAAPDFVMPNSFAVLEPGPVSDAVPDAASPAAADVPSDAC
jgi:hypothetical protein